MHRNSPNRNFVSFFCLHGNKMFGSNKSTELYHWQANKGVHKNIHQMISFSNILSMEIAMVDGYI